MGCAGGRLDYDLSISKNASLDFYTPILIYILLYIIACSDVTLHCILL